MRISVSFGAWLPVMRRLADGGDCVALSYDDGPNPDSTPHLLDVLDAHGAKASFFLSGCRAVRHPDIIGDIVRRGHEVYAHGWEHIRLDRATPDCLVEALEKAEALLRRWRPTPDPYMVRLPYSAGDRSARVHRAIRRWHANAQYAHWGASCEDHTIAGRCRSQEDVVRECQRAVETLFATRQVAGLILLLHDQPIGIESEYAADVTIRLTERLLAEFRRRELRGVPIAPLPRRPILSRFALM